MSSPTRRSRSCRRRRSRATTELTVTWIGHATVLVELDGIRALTDPLLGHLGPLRRVGAPVPMEDALRADAVLLSHLHADHTDLRSLRRLGRQRLIFAPPGARPWLVQRGFTRIRECAEAIPQQLGPLTIVATAAEHDTHRHQFGHEASAVGFLVRGTRTVYFAGDTDLFPGMSELAGLVDLALLPVGGWGPSLGPGHLDPERAAEAARLIKPRVAIPIHWGSLEPPWPVRWLNRHRQAGYEFAAAVERVAPDVEVRVLEPGAGTTLT